MDFSQLIKMVDSLSSYDLFRLNQALEIELNAPKRIAAIKSALKLGESVFYFDFDTNCDRLGIVTEIRKSRATILDIETQQKWDVPLYTLNLQGREVHFSAPNRDGLHKADVTVGETVAFIDHQGVEHAGQVMRLNPKTVTLLENKIKWRVPYSYLKKVIEHQQDSLLLEHESD